jgi:hypothetical protein
MLALVGELNTSGRLYNALRNSGKVAELFANAAFPTRSFL